MLQLYYIALKPIALHKSTYYHQNTESFLFWKHHFVKIFIKVFRRKSMKYLEKIEKVFREVLMVWRG